MTIKTAFIISGVMAAGWGVLFYGATRGCSCSTKAKAYQASMKSDLRNMTTAQEEAFRRDAVYSIHVDSALFQSSSGVTIRILEATRTGWVAETEHSQVFGRCVIYVGRPFRIPTVTTGTVVPEGEPRCDKETSEYRPRI